MNYDLNKDKIYSKDYDETPFLKSQLNNLQMKVQLLKRENDTLRKQIKGMKHAPGIVGVVQEIIGEKALVRNYNGVVFAVSIPEKFRNKLEVGTRVALAQHNLMILDIFSKDVDYRVTDFDLEDRPNINYKNVGGLEEEIQELEEMVTLPLTKPELFKNFGIDSPKGILLYGPPGTGKTLIARAIASQSNAKFISLSGSDLVHKYIGEGARLVRDLFKFARDKQPSIIFIDEIDSVASYRTNSNSGGDREVHRTMMQLLVELDGFRSNDKVKVLAATNRIDIIDRALLRPGRLDRIVHISLPKKTEREEILKIHTKDMPLDKKVSIKDLAKETEGASGADIASICREAAMFAIREKNKKVSIDNFRDAIKKALESNEEEDIKGLI